MRCVVQHFDRAYLTVAPALHLYAQGGDLDHMICQLKEAGKKLEESLVLDWFVQLTNAIWYIHNRYCHILVCSLYCIVPLSDKGGCCTETSRQGGSTSILSMSHLSLYNLTIQKHIFEG